MKKIGYIIAAIYAVFSLSVTSFALPELIQGAEDVVDTVADDAEDLLGGEGGSDTQADDPVESGSDTQADDPIESGSDTQADDPIESGSDTSADDPVGSSDTSADVLSSSDVTTTPPTNVSNAGSGNPSTGAGAVLGFTALGMAVAGLTAAATRKRK